MINLQDVILRVRAVAQRVLAGHLQRIVKRRHGILCRGPERAGGDGGGREGEGEEDGGELHGWVFWGLLVGVLVVWWR